jgi:hypothetical protein
MQQFDAMNNRQFAGFSLNPEGAASPAQNRDNSIKSRPQNDRLLFQSEPRVRLQATK